MATETTETDYKTADGSQRRGILLTDFDEEGKAMLQDTGTGKTFEVTLHAQSGDVIECE